MTLFVVLGAICLAVGLGLLAVAIRHHGEQRPRHGAMLIGGMMATAFGIIIAGFALAYQSAPPLDLNSAEPGR